MANIKLHLMVGQGLLGSTGGAQSLLTDGGDPQDLWYAVQANSLWFDAFAETVGLPYDPDYANTWRDGGDDPNRGEWGIEPLFLREVCQAEPSENHCLVKLIGSAGLRAISGEANRRDKAGADLYDDIAAKVTACKAAIESALPGSTFELGSLSICFGYVEAANYGTDTDPANNLADDLSQFVTDLRSDLSALLTNTTTAPILLYKIHEANRITVGGPYLDAGVNACRNAMGRVKALHENVEIVDVDETALRLGGIWSTAQATRECGLLLFEAYQRVASPGTVPSVDGGIPVVVYLGQSNVNGQRPLETLTQFFNADDELINGGAAWPDVWTGDFAADQVVPYNPTVNSNTEPTWGNLGAFGPDVSMVAELRKIHSDGMVLIKLGVGSSSIGPNTTDQPVWGKAWPHLVYASGALQGESRSVWPVIEEGWRRFRQSIVEVTGRVPEVRLIVWHQGESDSEESLYLQYQSNLEQHLADLRSLFATDTAEGSVIPVAICKTRRVPGGPFDTDRTDVIRAAQETVAAQPGNHIVDLDEMPYASDDVHLSAEGTLRAGREIVASLPATYTSVGVGG